MSIDPVKIHGITQTAARKYLSDEISKQRELNFDEFLNTAKSRGFAGKEMTSQAVDLVQQTRQRMMQGVVDLLNEPEESTDLSRLTRVYSLLQTSPPESQNRDKTEPALPTFQASLAKPVQTEREEIEQLIERVARHVRLDPNLIRSVVNTESNFETDATSHAGAQGLMQLMPETAKELGVSDRLDPGQNLLGGSRYLKKLLDKYDGDLDHALAAYNWGQGNVDRKGLENMPRETRDYLKRVKSQLAG